MSVKTERVLIFDTTLRDGEQAPGFSMKPGEKLLLARQIEALGVDVLEAGFPIASQGDFEGVQAVARACRECRVAALARAVEADVRRAAEALAAAARPCIHVFLATSDIHLRHKLRKSREQVVADTGAAVRLARQFADDVEFSAEDATRSDVDFLVEVLSAAVSAGATTLNIPDTVGYAVPGEYAALIAHLRGRVGAGPVFSVHCHNDLGLAVANSLAAVAAGARQIECTINGIGERAGNASLEELVMAMYVRSDALPFATGIRTELLHPTSRMLSGITGIEVQPNKAIVGRNAFAHEAGIHQDGVLKSPLTYEIMTPQVVGLAHNELVLGKHSGRHALKSRLAALGYDLDHGQLDRAYRQFIAVADERKSVGESDLHGIARACGGSSAAMGAAGTGVAS